LKFKALLLVRSFASPIARQPQELVIAIDPSISEVDLATDDVLFNSITMTTQLCRKGDGKPWRGAKEKSEVLMKLFVHGLSPIGGIVADMTASTGIVTLLATILNYIFFYFLFGCFIHTSILMSF
jgi:hypothetical protein